VIAYSLVLGPYAVYQRLVRPTWPDLRELSNGCFTSGVSYYVQTPSGDWSPTHNSPQGWLRDRYPDLPSPVSSDDGNLCAHKLRADMIAHAHVAVWLGVLLSAALCLLPIVSQALVADALLRRHGRVWPMLLLYLELSTGWSWLFLDLVSALLVSPLLEDRAVFSWVAPLTIGTLLVLGTLGSRYGWGALTRWSLYLSVFFTLRTLGFSHWEHPWTGLYLDWLPPEVATVGLIVTGPLGIVLLLRHYWRLSRRGRSPEPHASPTR
jgi:hypothetical protein